MIAAAALYGGGCGNRALQTAAPPRTISPAASTVIFNCDGTASREPRDLSLACADDSNVLARLRWGAWGTATATAAGVAEVDLCEPNCAAGKIETDPVTVAASGLALVGTRAAYRTLTVQYLARVPAGLARTERYVLSSTGPVPSE